MAEKKKPDLKGKCNIRCYNAKGDRCNCRCKKQYHGLGRKNASEQEKKKQMIKDETTTKTLL